MVRFPIEPEELARFRDLLPTSKPDRPYAFVYGHGLWNDLDLQATLNWLDLVEATARKGAPWLDDGLSSLSTSSLSSVPNTTETTRNHAGFWPRLFVTPNAAGKGKPDEWLVSQGNKALMVFEQSVGIEVAKRGVDHLGTWNMSVQSNKFDGV